MARLLTLDGLAGHTQHTRCLSLSSSPLFTHTHTHTHTRHTFKLTPLSSVLELAVGCTPVRSAQYSTLPKKPPLSLLIVHWRPHIATVIAVSQQSITRQCETATPLQRKHDAALHCHFPRKLLPRFHLTSVLKLHPPAWPPSAPLSPHHRTTYHLAVIQSLDSLSGWWPSHTYAEIRADRQTHAYTLRFTPTHTCAALYNWIRRQIITSQCILPATGCVTPTDFSATQDSNLIPLQSKRHCTLKISNMITVTNLSDTVVWQACWLSYWEFNESLKSVLSLLREEIAVGCVKLARPGGRFRRNIYIHMYWKCKSHDQSVSRKRRRASDSLFPSLWKYFSLKNLFPVTFSTIHMWSKDHRTKKCSCMCGQGLRISLFCSVSEGVWTCCIWYHCVGVIMIHAVPRSSSQPPKKLGDLLPQFTYYLPILLSFLLLVT